tara:strand:+ start:1274 stop:1519 length:246 start_codon:yes stop_codon:yes gene_type:complete
MSDSKQDALNKLNREKIKKIYKSLREVNDYIKFCKEHGVCASSMTQLILEKENIKASLLDDELKEITQILKIEMQEAAWRR